MHAATVRSAVLATVVVVVLGVVVTGALLSIEVEGRSMEPTLQARDRVLVRGVTTTSDVGRLDLVVLHPPDSSRAAIKRVVGLPGDRVRVRPATADSAEQVDLQVGGHGPWRAYHGGRVGDEVGADGPAAAVVAEGTVWVLGDNLAASVDSRDYGPVPIDRVDGRVWLQVWPLSDLGRITRP